MFVGMLLFVKHSSIVWSQSIKSLHSLDKGILGHFSCIRISITHLVLNYQIAVYPLVEVVMLGSL